MMKTRIIINPISGKGKQLKLIPLLDQYLDKSRFDFEVIKTERAKHAMELTTDAVALGYDLVIAVGGDGSVNEVGRRLIHSNCALGIIPTGSGNGFARTLGIPLKWKKAIEHLNQAEIKTIDTGLINEEKFIGLAGIGFDGLISHKFDKAPTRGLKTYLTLIGLEMVNFKPFHCKIESRDGQFEGEIAVVVAANSQQWGNEAKIAPMASLTDGKIDLVVIPKLPKWRIPQLGMRIMSGSLHRSSMAHVISSPEATIITQYPFSHVDGEPVVFDSKIKVKSVPLSLKVLG